MRLLFSLIIIINIFLIFGGCTLKTTSTTTVKKTQSFQKNPCDYSSYSEAIIPNSVYSLNKFLRSCTNNTDAYHKLVTDLIYTNQEFLNLIINKKGRQLTMRSLPSDLLLLYN